MSASLLRGLLALALASCATSREKSGLAAPFAREDTPVPMLAERRFALLVGVDAYEDPRFAPLRFAGRDARELSRALAGFTEVRTLATTETTSRANFLSELQWLSRTANRRSDTVVVFVSSHGTLGQRPGGALERVIVARDTRLDVPLTTGLPVAELLAELSRFGARRRLLVLATCHSGSGKSQLSDELSRALAGHKGPPPLAATSEATIVLTACAFNETAREDEGLQGDVYTHFVLEALGRADRDADGAVTASEAHDWARERTYGFTRGLQRPTAESAVLGTDPIVLSGRRVRPSLPVLFSYAPAADGVRVEVDGVAKGTLPGGVAVSPGVHQVRLTDSTTGKALYDGRLELASGEPLDLARVLPSPLELRVSLAGTALLPLLSRTRGAMGTLGGGAVDLRLSGARLGRWSLGLEGRAGAGQGLAPGLQTQVPFDVQAAGAAISLGPGLGLTGRLRVTPALFAGWLALWRQLRSETFFANQTAGGPWAGARVELSWAFSAPLSLVAGAELSGLFADLGTGSSAQLLFVPSLRLAAAL